MRKLIISSLLFAIILPLNALAEHHKETTDFAGIWSVVASVENSSPQESVLTLKKADGRWSGTTVGEDGIERKLSRIERDGKTLTVEIEVTQNGQSGIIGAKADLNESGALVGKWYIRGEDGTEYMSNDWRAARSAASILPGEWTVVAKTEESDLTHGMKVSKGARSFSAVAISEAGENAYENIVVNKNELKMEIPFGAGRVKIAANATEAMTLIGKWTYFDENRIETATGKWTATKDLDSK